MKYSKKTMLGIWLPVVALVAIVLGAMTLYGCMQTSSAHEGDRVTTQALLDTSSTLPSAETLDAGSAEGKDEPVQYWIVESKEMQGGPSEGEPWPSDVTLEAAAKIAADGIRLLFDDALADKTLYVQYMRYDNQFADSAFYNIQVGTDDYETCEYFAVVNAASGVITYLERPNHSQFPDGPFDSPERQAMVEEANKVMYGMENEKESVIARVRTLIEEKYANGRTIEKLSLDAVQWTGDAAQGDIWVYMDEGACYIVHMLYPSFEIAAITVYPLGRESMEWGYQNESQRLDMIREREEWAKQMDEIQQREENWKAENGSAGEPVPTPAPTLSPAP